MKNWLSAFKEDFRFSVLGSRLKTIKFIVICLIPFLYGFFCVWAYWNPIVNISEIPMAIVNRDQKACYSLTLQGGIVVHPELDEQHCVASGDGGKYYYTSVTDDAFEQLLTDKVNRTIHVEKPGTEININPKYLYGKDTDFAPYDKYWTQIKLPSTYSIDLLSTGSAFTHLIYASQFGTKAQTDAYQLALKNDLMLITGQEITPDLVPEVGTQARQYYDEVNGPPITNAENAKGHAILFWSTYKFNFLGGQFMYVFNEFKYSLLNTLIPNAINTLLLGNLLDHRVELTPSEIAHNPALSPNYSWASMNRTIATIQPLADGWKTVSPFLKPIIPYLNGNLGDLLKVVINTLDSLTANDNYKDKIVNELFKDGIEYKQESKYDDMTVRTDVYNSRLKDFIDSYVLPYDGTDFIQNRVEGTDRGEYGVGLGEFFLCVALWVGVLMQTFIYDRTRRGAGIKNPFAHYFSKLALMMITSWIQCAVLIITLLIIGFTALGPSFGLYLLWMLFAMTIFTFIIHGLWFLPSDGDVGKFIGVIYMILNLASGWGTFPPFMQSPFFEAISYIMPFTYVIHGQGTIIYGVGVIGATPMFLQQIWQWFGILLIFAAVFVILGYLGTWLRSFQERYHTFNKVKLYRVLNEMQHTSALQHAQLLNKNNKWVVKGKIDLSKLSLMEEAIFRKKMLELYPPSTKKHKLFKSRRG